MTELPTVTLPVAIVTLLSLTIGIVTQIKQSRSIFGEPLPPKLLAIIAFVVPGLAGAVSVLQSQQTLNSSIIFWAVVNGVGQMFTASVPGLAMHAHYVVPKAMIKK